ncbi:MAG: hypothetical protein Pg6C_04890 [Treponemataceae bacterium]|nr:MAG: hypothetical protein Pg6C_04890 [Treponemataceae bacterium]
MENSPNLAMYGFKTGGRTSLNSRTMMLKELSALLQAASSPAAGKSGFLKAVIDDNCLGKKSGVTRKLSAAHLENMYALDTDLLIFKALRFFWQRDAAGRPLLALTCLYSRDYVIRAITPTILGKREGEAISKEAVQEELNNRYPGVFSNATVESTTRNILSTFTQSGHLRGRRVKTRSRAVPTAGTAAYSLLLAHICGYRGESLLSCEYINLLDCAFGKAVELAETASRSGWISFKHVDTVYDISFPNKDLGVRV